MTKIFIIEVEEGASYEGCIYDYWINCKLTNSIEVKLFDFKRLNLHHFINEWIYADIHALFVEKGIKDNLRIFKGKIIEKDDNFYFTNDFINIEVSKEDIDNERIELNVLDNFSFGRLDIVSIQDYDNESPQS
jgi:hypothetical protein